VGENILRRQNADLDITGN